jgi:transposase
VSGLDPTLEPLRAVRRVEIINGIGGRRRWSVDDKARIIEETLAPGAVVSAIARHHGLTPQQLFGWRRAARRSTEVGDDIGSPRFVPAVVEQPKPEPVRKQRKPRRVGRASDATGIIEMEIGGVVVRVGRGAEAKTVAAVIHALKATP